MKLTITRKLGSGFGVIILAVLISLFLSNRTSRKYQELQTKIMTVLNPSRDNLVKFSDMISTSKMLTKNWVHVDKIADTPDKIALADLHNKEFPELRDNLLNLSKHWTKEERTQLENVCIAVQDTLFRKQKYVMNSLSDVLSYEDPLVFFEISMMVDEGGEITDITNQVVHSIDELRGNFDAQVQAAQEQITNDYTGFQRLLIITNIALIIIVLISAMYSQVSIVRPLKKIDTLIRKLSTGNLSEKSNIRQNDEIGMIANSTNTLIDGLRSTTEFADEIGKGHLDAAYQALSDDDILGHSLLNMRQSLQNADAEAKKRRLEDERRNWVAQGLAKFAEILRDNNRDMDTMTHEVLYNLVRYIDANQGALFIVNDNDPQHIYLEMRSCYAYDRKKFAEKTIEPGEGLAGAAFQEGETIYMTEVPRDYVQITSGLGGDTPSAILIVPLKVNEEVFGVLEIGAFTEIEKHVKELVEKISESIASTISSLKVSERTGHLLEQAKIQAQEMSEQEEELRQNMEELQATQEEWQRKEAEYRSFNDAIDSALSVIELSDNLEILQVNQNVVNKTGVPESLFLHRKYTDFLKGNEDMAGRKYDQLWTDLQEGNMRETTGQLEIQGKTYICRQLFIPEKNTYHEIYKYLCIMTEIRPVQED